MGHLKNGQWEQGAFPTDEGGNYRRPPTTFRDKISDAPDARFPPEAGRYHLYVSYACPWAHRTLILRKLKGLEPHITLSVVDPHMGKAGWHFSNEPGCLPDPIFQARHLYEIYQKADPNITTRVTVPILWDKKNQTIINNESREIIRMFDTQFEKITDSQWSFYSDDQADFIESRMDEIYEPINNGVYRCGFATSQEAYDRAVGELFAKLDDLEILLGKQPYLCGKMITEADWCLFTTLIRFDLVYYFHFKCNIRPIQSYPYLWDYLRRLYHIPGVAETCHFDHIKTHYFWSHETVNPHRIVPAGPVTPWWEQEGQLKRFQGRYLDMFDDQGWEYVERSRGMHAVVMVPLSTQGKIILIEQERKPLGRKVLEFPAGLIGDEAQNQDESWREAAGRELSEETGYRAQAFEFLCEGPPSPGLANEKVVFALAQGCERVGPGGGNDGEEITVHEVEREGLPKFLKEYLAQGGVIDPKIYAGLYFLP